MGIDWSASARWEREPGMLAPLFISFPMDWSSWARGVFPLEIIARDSWNGTFNSKSIPSMRSEKGSSDSMREMRWRKRMRGMRSRRKNKRANERKKAANAIGSGRKKRERRKAHEKEMNMEKEANLPGWIPIRSANLRELLLSGSEGKAFAMRMRVLSAIEFPLVFLEKISEGALLLQEGFPFLQLVGNLLFAEAQGGGD